VTPFLYFGPLSFDLLFHLFFMQRHSRLLEEGSGRSPARFSWLLLIAASMLLALGALLHLQFLGSSLSSTLMYVWGRRNPDAVLSFLGLFTFRAPFLPWVLMAFNVMLNGHVPKDEICGVVVGHSTRLETCSWNFD
jgi:Derlin-2/3